MFVGTHTISFLNTPSKSASGICAVSVICKFPIPNTAVSIIAT